MPRLEPVDEEFFTAAPQRRSYALDLPVSPERVWRGLTASNPLWWCRLATAEYASPRPFGVGTTRRATALGVLRLRESAFRWEEGRRQSFRAESANLPLFRRFGEDHLVEPAAGGCLFTWTFAWEPAERFAGRRFWAERTAQVCAALAADTRRHFSR
ncbi:SRPBCC family protein [Saccharothrix lopnurensis]|uniref:SRPBCC family protein n=1 Tax=Saccharothrix lopnurensis TaxID=1670621 RepID=A0ABW1PBK6_9PSEU